MQTEHPFAEIIRILGKGRNGSRGLTSEEAYSSMSMILRNEVEPVQLGAFLMLMRVKEETPEEVASSVQAIKDNLQLPENLQPIDLDWSSYAGKKRVLPWYILSLLLLAENGIKTLIHGASGHTAGRIYTKNIFPQLGLPVASSLQQANDQIAKSNLSYIDLEHLHPKLHEIIELRPLLGLRSPVHTIARMMNPLNAPYVMQGIFHPGYRPTHQEAGQLLQMNHMAVIKGEGGEIERNPDIPLLIQSVHDGVMADEEWPAMFDKRHVRSDDLQVEDLRALWQGSKQDEYGEAAVIGTVAVTLYTMQKAANREHAEAMATEWWQQRDTSRI